MYNIYWDFNNNFKYLLLKHSLPKLYISFFEKVYDTSLVLNRDSLDELPLCSQLEEIFSDLPQPNAISTMCTLLSLFGEQNINNLEILEANQPANDLYYVCSQAVAIKIGLSNKIYFKKNTKNAEDSSHNEKTKLDMFSLRKLVKTLLNIDDDDIVSTIVEKIISRYTTIFKTYTLKFPLSKKANVNTQLYSYIFSLAFNALLDTIRKYKVDPYNTDSYTYIYTDSLNAMLDNMDNPTSPMDKVADNMPCIEDMLILKEDALDFFQHQESLFHLLVLVGRKLLHKKNTCIAKDISQTQNKKLVLKQYLEECNQLKILFTSLELQSILDAYPDENISCSYKYILNKISLILPKSR